MADILVIDDDGQIRGLLVRLLQLSGHSVAAAENGSVGLKILGNRNFDLVVTDIFMPEKEGFETIREIKKNYPWMKILAISGGDAQGNNFLSMAKPLGADGTLGKPFDNEEIISLVEILLAST